MRIELHNLWAKVSERSDEERSFLIDYLEFEEDERYVQHKGGRPKRIKPPSHKLFNVLNDTFPSGMAEQVKRAAERAGFEVDLVDARVSPFPLAADTLDGADWLRPYQRRAATIAAERSRGILWMPTGSGKTEVAVGLATCIDCRWLFLVHRKGLLGQAADRFELRTGEVAGRIGEGKWSEERFTVATFQTISRALRSKDKATRHRAQNLLASQGGLVVDESHVLPADSFWQVAMQAANAHWRIGMSGTPVQRGDRRAMLAIAALGPVLYRLKPAALVREGVLARPIIRLIPVEQDSSKPTWQGVYGECIVRSVQRNKAVVAAVERCEKPCLVFVKEIKHGRQLVKRLEKAGMRTEFAYGKHSSDWRDNLIASLVRGDIEVLVTSVIMQEGIDIPSLESVVIASGGKSAIAAIQRIGRGMRSDGGRKESFQVYDFADQGHRWLERHTKERVKAYKAEGFEPEEDGSFRAWVQDTEAKQ